MTNPTLLGLSGALRQGSTNTKLLAEAARLFGDATYNLGNLHLPLYDGDIETDQGIPKSVQTLAAQIAAADAIIISSPEYNSGVTGVLKNALDWISRVEGNPWAAKPVAVMSAAAGRSGGVRAQTMLRSCLTPFNPAILQGPEIALAESYNQFDDTGRLTNEMAEKQLTALMAALRAMAQA